MSLYNGPVRHIHFEATSECNSRCPQCLRTYHQSLETHPLLNIRHWDPEDLGRVLADPFFWNAHSALINGNYGDILLHPDPRAILEAFIERGYHLEINTNGSVRGPDFWAWMVSQRSELRVVFAIDGLEDTHHLYRRKTNYRAILRNARQFIQGGGRATWAMTVFDHNRHQVEECRRLAKEMGFEDFIERPSTRWSDAEMSIAGDDFEHAYSLKPAIATKPLGHYGHSAETYRKGKTDYRGTFGMEDWEYTHTGKAEIVCRTSRQDSVYLTYDGRMWPCCWTASGFEQHLKGIQGNSIFDIYEDAYRKDPDFNNVVKYSPTEVYERLAGFQRIVDSLSSEKPCTSCYHSCRKESAYESQVQNQVKEQFTSYNASLDRR